MMQNSIDIAKGGIWARTVPHSTTNETDKKYLFSRHQCACAGGDSSVVLSSEDALAQKAPPWVGAVELSVCWVLGGK